jgi:hypothetical protein
LTAAAPYDHLPTIKSWVPFYVGEVLLCGIADTLVTNGQFAIVESSNHMTYEMLQ